MKKLQLLEEEENKLLEEELKNNNEDENENENEDDDDSFDENDELLFRYIRRKRLLSKQLQSHKNAVRSNRSSLARADKTHSLNELQDKLQDLGIDTARVSRTIKEEQTKRESTHRGRSHSRSRRDKNDPDEAAIINDPKSSLDIQEIARSQSRGRSHGRSHSQARSDTRSRSRSRAPSKGISSLSASKMAHNLKLTAIKNIQSEGRKHESDRYIPNAKPKHLFSGHRGAHKGDWR